MFSKWPTRCLGASRRQTPTLCGSMSLCWWHPPFRQRRLGPRDYMTGGSPSDAGVREATQTTAPTYLNVQVRLEIKL